LALSLFLSRLERRERGERLRDLAATKWALLAALVMWLPALIEPLVHPPGNLPEVARFFVSGSSGDGSVGLAHAAGLLATEFRVMPPWLGGGDPINPVSHGAVGSSLLWFLIPAMCLALAGVSAWRHNDRRAKRTVILVVGVVMSTIFTLSRITGSPFAYLMPWRVTVAVVVVLLSAWALASAKDWFRGSWRPVAWTGVLSVLVVAVSIGSAVAVADHPRALTPYESVTQQFVDELSAAGQPHNRVLTRFAGSALGGVHAGIVDELDRRGHPVFVDVGAPYTFGRARAITADQSDEIWYVIEDGHALSLLTQRPGATVLVRTTPLDAADEDEIVDLQRRVARQLTVSGYEGRIEVLSSTRVAEALADVPGLDPVDLQRLDELNRLVAERGVCRCAVVSFAPSAAPE
jgi:hypothetical protein